MFITRLQHKSYKHFTLYLIIRAYTIIEVIYVRDYNLARPIDDNYLGRYLGYIFNELKIQLQVLKVNTVFLERAFN